MQQSELFFGKCKATNVNITPFKAIIVSVFKYMLSINRIIFRNTFPQTVGLFLLTYRCPRNIVSYSSITSMQKNNASVKKYRLQQEGEGGILVLQQGDLTKWHGDAVVNAANQRMLGGGGVDGAIHRAAGPQLLKACEQVPEVQPNIRCPTGEARITEGFNLPAKFVIHTVGPVYSNRNPEISKEKLLAAYTNSLKLANEKGLQTIAFPAISCGVFHYPVPDAAQVAITVCKENFGNLKEIHFVLFGNDTYDPFVQVADENLQIIQEEQ
eukprot:TRINITY_DN6141_c0_g1_i4.p1 TRINITY_DN6141_c0_g1~~TRINITY_DN6141_c0_g1_i4.p1  ORF type:complete len:269 (-),score=42.02 TRINITY_DN6141_c0_g1_i4:817-1623(-)